MPLANLWSSFRKFLVQWLASDSFASAFPLARENMQAEQNPFVVDSASAHYQ
jgi:hypothetical protein